MRYMTGLVILIAASMACSRDNERIISQLPSSPTSAAAATTIAYIGGVSGPMDVFFPGRNESFLFRIDLETKYATGLGRSATGTFVDQEGEVVWMQEYIRYRVNGCDHATALARVMTQIDGGAAGGICASPPAGVINFPPRTDMLEARRALEAKYEQMGRGLSSTAVDAEGSAIWITEYLRYRTNSCGHADAESKVFSQIDGGPVPPVCFQPCTYLVNPAFRATGFAASSQSFEVRPATGETERCQWTATSTVPWITFASDVTPGAGFTTIPYNIAGNSGGERTGYIDVAWSGGSARHQVVQQGTPFSASFTLVDSFRSSSTTTECWFRSTSTPCTFTATANLPGGGAYTYNWTASYVYDTTKTFVQNNNSNVFTFSDTCGLANSSPDGPIADLNVSVTITDSLGNTITLRSGEGNQPALRVRLFSC